MIRDEFVRQQAHVLMTNAKKALATDGQVAMMVMLACERHPVTLEPLDPEKCLVPVIGRSDDGPKARDLLLWDARFVATAGAARAAIFSASALAIVHRRGDQPPSREAALRDPAAFSMVIVATEWVDRLEVDVMAARSRRAANGVIEFDDVAQDMPINDCTRSLGSILVHNEDYTDIPDDILSRCRAVAAEQRSLVHNVMAGASARDVARG